MPEYSYKEILAHLVSFDTISEKSNLGLIDYLVSFLEKHHFRVERYYNPEKTKANCIARIGPETGGGILLAGHTDVVPVAGQPWSGDPFTLREKNDQLMGRGTADMKGYIALVCDAVSRLDQQKLRHPLILIFTYDEEIGCFGAKNIQNTLVELADQVNFALIGEPTNGNLVTAHKGLQVNRTLFTGKPAHSSCPHLGRSAIMGAASFLHSLAKKIPKEENPDFTPPAMTFNAGMIQGGNALNIIAEHCQLDWECRPLPNVSQLSLQQFIQRCSEETSSQSGVRVENTALSFVPGLNADENHRIVEFLKPFLWEKVSVTSAPFVTEAGIFQQSSIPTVVFGPGEIEQAHQPDEAVSIEAMERYRKFLLRLLASYCN